MHAVSRFVLLSSVTLALAAIASGQTVTPIPEMKNFVPVTGKWVYQEEVRSKPDGPWDKVSWTYEARWVGSVWEGRGYGQYPGIEFFGYDPSQKSRFYVGFSEKGELGRGTWEWIAERTLRLEATAVAGDGRQTPWRCIWEGGADSASAQMTCEQLADGKWWVFRQSKGTKQ